VREVFWNQVHTLDPRVNVNPQLVDPVAGALEMARRTGEKTRVRTAGFQPTDQ
jgi:hypothetical protein